MASVFERFWRPALLVIAGLAALAVAVELIRPLHAGAVGFDSAASVVYFDRITSGRHLESFVGATPKPLLTLVYGFLMAIFDDWRIVAWAAIGSYVASAVLAAIVGFRYGGALVAVAAVVSLLGSSVLLMDVAISYALSWALLFWLTAALALSGARPRYALAGVALGVATVARLETIAVVGVVVVALAIAALRDVRAARPVDRGPWWLLLALGALPVMLVHDLLLVGDPFFWLSVSAEYSRQNAASVISPAALAVFLGEHVLRMPIILILAIIGLVSLGQRRLMVPLVGLLGLIVGVAIFLFIIAARGTYVSGRYLGGIDIGLGFAAAFGVGALADVIIGRWARRIDAGSGPANGIATSTAWRRLAAPIVVGGVLLTAMVAGNWPPASLRHGVRAAVRNQVIEARHADMAIPVVRCALVASGATAGAASSFASAGDPSSTLVLGPDLLGPRLARDLGLPLFAVGGVPAASLDPSASFLPIGRIIVHDGRSDQPRDAFAVLEVDRPTVVGGVELTPLVHDRKNLFWIDWIRRPGDPPPPTRCAR